MKLTFLGHASFRLEIGGQVLLIDPWFTGSPVFPADQRDAAIEGVTHLLVTHGHGDHSADALAVAKEKGVKMVGIADLMSWWAAKEGVDVIAMNKGGTVDLGGVKVTMVNATHSSSIPGKDGEPPIYAGHESGFIIEGEGHSIYLSGDTDVMADMKIFNDLHHPDIGILCAGGHFTMDMRRAAYAAKTFFDFKTVIPCHYKTFPMLEQNADLLKSELTGVEVIEPEVMKTIEL
ncbi:metal-dependent hydrolase [Acidimangrovimonas sediminis]|uniref:metal-dependent hydrolase n=1 Tax=Acidimangrovimonas sediminis TaxID=2056283 RepID=UPI000C802FCC|nr:metal-dependent hydrolase [Acidimangrovimonas sediminis]